MRRGLLAAMIVALLAAVGCAGESGTPPQDLASAVATTFEGSWGWTMHAEVDSVFMESMEEDDPVGAVMLVEGFRLRGIVDADAFSLAADAEGIENIFEFRVLGEDAVYARADIDQIAAKSGFALPDPGSLLEGMAEYELDPSIGQLLRTALAGDWVGLTGLAGLAESLEQDLGMLAPTDMPSLDPFDLERMIRDAFGDDPDAVIDRFATVTEESSEGEIVYLVEVKLREMMESAASLAEELVAGQLDGFGLPGMSQGSDFDLGLADVPAVLPVTVTVRDGALAEIRIHAVALFSDVSPDVTGTFDVVLSLDDSPDPVVAPDDAAVVTGDALQEAIGAFMLQLFNPFGEFPLDFFSEVPAQATGFHAR